MTNAISISPAQAPAGPSAIPLARSTTHSARALRASQRVTRSEISDTASRDLAGDTKLDERSPEGTPSSRLVSIPVLPTTVSHLGPLQIEIGSVSAGKSFAPRVQLRSFYASSKPITLEANKTQMLPAPGRPNIPDVSAQELTSATTRKQRRNSSSRSSAQNGSGGGSSEDEAHSIDHETTPATEVSDYSKDAVKPAETLMRHEYNRETWSKRKPDRWPGTYPLNPKRPAMATKTSVVTSTAQSGKKISTTPLLLVDVVYSGACNIAISLVHSSLHLNSVTPRHIIRSEFACTYSFQFAHDWDQHFSVKISGGSQLPVEVSSPFITAKEWNPAGAKPGKGIERRWTLVLDDVRGKASWVL